MTQLEFSQAMAVLIAGVGKAMPDEQVEIWRECFIDADAADFRRAIVATLRDYKFAGFPPIGFVADRAGVAGSGVPDADAIAVLAWDAVLTAMRELGGYRSVRFDDPVIPAAIAACSESWAALCETEIEQLHSFTRARFLQAYKALRSAGGQTETVVHGILAKDAGRIGGDVPDPSRIGEQPVAVLGFGGEKLRALPAPEPTTPLRLPGLTELARSMDLPAEYSPEPTITPARSVEEQRRILSVKYGLTQ